MEQSTIWPAGTVLTSTTNSSDQTSGQQRSLQNWAGKGAVFMLDVTAVSGTTPSLTLKIQAKDPISGNYVDIPGAAFAAITSTGTRMLQVHPAVTTVANSVVSAIIPTTYRAVATITGTTPSFTLSLSTEEIQ